VCLAHTGEEVFFLINAEPFDLVILDLMLPGRDGIDILMTLRKRNLLTPVIIMTARDTIDERVRGLDSDLHLRNCMRDYAPYYGADKAMRPQPLN